MCCQKIHYKILSEDFSRKSCNAYFFIPEMTKRSLCHPASSCRTLAAVRATLTLSATTSSNCRATSRPSRRRTWRGQGVRPYCIRCSSLMACWRFRVGSSPPNDFLPLRCCVNAELLAFPVGWMLDPSIYDWMKAGPDFCVLTKMNETIKYNVHFITGYHSDAIFHGTNLVFCADKDYLPPMHTWQYLFVFIFFNNSIFCRHLLCFEAIDNLQNLYFYISIIII